MNKYILIAFVSFIMVLVGCKDKEKSKQEAISRRIRSGHNIIETEPRTWIPFGELSNETDTQPSSSLSDKKHRNENLKRSLHM